MPAAADADGQRRGARAEDGGAEAALRGREDDGGRLADAREREAEVVDGGVEERGVGRGRREGEVGDAMGDEAVGEVACCVVVTGASCGGGRACGLVE